MLMKHLLFACILVLCVAGCSKDNTKTEHPNTTYNVNSIKDVQYGQNTNFAGDNEKLSLDIYSPKNASATKKYPLLIMAHGGSFLTGNKNNLSELCQALAEKGFIAVSIDYRLGWDYGNAQSPSACNGDTTSLQKAVYRSLQDYNAALRFLVHDADKYFIDTNWVFIGGSSAGAVAAVNTTYVTPDFVTESYFEAIRQELGGLKNTDNNLTDAFTIKGNVSLWGAVVSPSLITPSTAVPMVAFHGSADQTVPIDDDHYALCDNYPLLYGSRYIYGMLTNYGIPAVLHVAEDEGHDPDMYNDPVFLSTNINCFLQSLMSKSAVTGSYQNLVSSCP